VSLVVHDHEFAQRHSTIH